MFNARIARLLCFGARREELDGRPAGLGGQEKTFQERQVLWKIMLHNSEILVQITFRSFLNLRVLGFLAAQATRLGSREPSVFLFRVGLARSTCDLEVTETDLAETFLGGRTVAKKKKKAAAKKAAPKRKAKRKKK